MLTCGLPVHPHSTELRLPPRHQRVLFADAPGGCLSGAAAAEWCWQPLPRLLLCPALP